VASDENLTSFRPRVWWAVVESNERFSVQSSTNQPTNGLFVAGRERKQTRRGGGHFARQTRRVSPGQTSCTQSPVSPPPRTRIHSFIHPLPLLPHSASSVPLPVHLYMPLPLPSAFSRIHPRKQLSPPRSSQIQQSRPAENN
jgi:hypothetical protein